MEMHFDHRALIIGVNIQNQTDPQASQHIFADVILIDKSHDILHPLLYQIKNENLDVEMGFSQYRRNDYLTLDPHAFAMLGEVLLIEKPKKLIHLKKEITVSYKHLILASGLSQTYLGSIHEEELNAGFHALSEALRVSSHAAQLLHHPIFDSIRKQHPIPSFISAKQKEDSSFLSLAKAIPVHSNHPSLDMALAKSERRLYEVQL